LADDSDNRAAAAVPVSFLNKGIASGILRKKGLLISM
jgi:hypothetical protein